MINVLSGQEIERMKKSANLLKDVFKLVEDIVKEGISTFELDEKVHAYILKRGGVPSFLNYHGYPASICASIDDVVVHGIPSKKSVLKSGQIIGIDIGVIIDGFHSDCARTYMIGDVSEEKKQLVEVTKQCFFEAIKDIKSGSRLGDIGCNVQTYAESYGYGVVTALTGHGIGKNMHEEPSIPNVGVCGKGVRLSSGMALAIEPMINMGVKDVIFMNDGWTCKTKDGLPSAHYENTVIVTDMGVDILTL